MKLSNYLEHIENIEIFPIVGLVIFMAFFVLLLLWVFKSEKAVMDEHASMPFDEQEIELQHKEQTQNSNRHGQ